MNDLLPALLTNRFFVLCEQDPYKNMSILERTNVINKIVADEYNYLREDINDNENNING